MKQELIKLETEKAAGNIMERNFNILLSLLVINRIHSKIINKDKKQQECGEILTFIHCWLKCKILKTL